MSQKYLDYVQFKNENLKVRDTEARGLIQDNANEIAGVKSKANLNEQKINALTPRVDTAEEDIEALKHRMTTAENDIDVAETRILANEAAVLGLDRRLDVVEPAVETLGQKVNSLETAVDSIEDNIALIQGKDVEQDGRLDDLEGDVGTLKTKMTAAEGRLDDIEAVNKAQDDAIQELDEKIVASTYEAGIGIYFGQGVDHTNINVEDELLDEIHASTAKNIEQDERLDDIEENAVYEVKVNLADNKKLDVIKKDDSVKNEVNGTVTSTPSGTVASSFTGDQMSLTGTPSGSVSSSGTFTGDQMTLSGTPTGTVASSASGTAVVLSSGTLPSKAADSYTASSCVYDGNSETIYFTPGSFTEGAFSAGTFPAVQSVTDPTVTSSFTGDQSSFTGTPSGTVAVSSSFTGDQMNLTGTPSGSVASTFTGTEATNDVIFADTGSLPPLTITCVPATTQDSPDAHNISYTSTKSTSTTFVITTSVPTTLYLSEVATIDRGGQYYNYVSTSYDLPAGTTTTSHEAVMYYRVTTASPSLRGSWKLVKCTYNAVDALGRVATIDVFLKVTVTE